MIDFHVLNFRAAAVGGGFVEPQVFTYEGNMLGPTWVERLGQSGPLTFLLHGFNVDWLNGWDTARRFALLLRELAPNLEGHVVAVLWPGDDRLSPITYSREERDADETATRLSRALTTRIRPSQPIDFVAHSLGSRVTLETMTQLVGSGVLVDRALLMAAAVDADAVARPSRYRDAVSRAGRVFWLASQRDLVLRYAFPIGDLVASILFGGYTQSALGLVGPRPARNPDSPVPNTVAGQSLTEFGVGHGDYLPGNQWPAAPLQRNAAHFAAQVLAGALDPAYP